MAPVIGGMATVPFKCQAAASRADPNVLTVPTPTRGFSSIVESARSILQMKEDREPWLHKLACTQQRKKSHPNKSGDTFLTKRPMEVSGDTFSD